MTTPASPVPVTVGSEKVSVTIYRKTHDDLLVSQLSLERWFRTPDDANVALRGTIDTLLSFSNHLAEESRT